VTGSMRVVVLGRSAGSAPPALLCPSTRRDPERPGSCVGCSGSETSNDLLGFEPSAAGGSSELVAASSDSGNSCLGNRYTKSGSFERTIADVRPASDVDVRKPT
jgi:hypothetical protein